MMNYHTRLGELGEAIGYGNNPKDVISNFLEGGCGIFAIALSRALTDSGVPHKIHHIVHYYGEVDDEEVNIKPKEQKNNIHIEAPYNDVSKHLQDVAKNRANVGHIFVSFGGKDYDIRGAFNPDAYVRSKMKIEESGIITLRDINDLRKLNKYTSFYESASSTELRGLMKLENDIYEFLKKTL